MTKSPYVFWPVPLTAGEDGSPFEFQCEGRDRAGRLVQFTQSLLYAEDLEAGAAYYDQSPEKRRTAFVRQQAMSFAAESAVPLTVADLNPESLGWISRLVANADGGNDPGPLLGGSTRAQAALTGLQSAVTPNTDGSVATMAAQTSSACMPRVRSPTT